VCVRYYCVKTRPQETTIWPGYWNNDAGEGVVQLALHIERTITFQILH